MVIGSWPVRRVSGASPLTALSGLTGPRGAKVKGVGQKFLAAQRPGGSQEVLADALDFGGVGRVKLRAVARPRSGSAQILGPRGLERLLDQIAHDGREVGGHRQRANRPRGPALAEALEGP